MNLPMKLKEKTRNSSRNINNKNESRLYESDFKKSTQKIERNLNRIGRISFIERELQEWNE